MRQLWLLVAVAGCATATEPSATVDAPMGSVDAPRVDAPIQIDAPTGCTMMTSNLLMNPAFEMTATGWMQTLIDGEAIVRADGPVAAHSPTMKAWLGGVLGEILGPPAQDAIWQDIAIPSSTTMVRITGMYDVRTTETSTGTAFDTATLALVTTANAPLESILALSNLTPKTTWTAIDHPVSAAVAGMTIRLRMASSNDFTSSSSFYFDSLAVMATFCGP
jgi:hypothetical protein